MERKPRFKDERQDDNYARDSYTDENINRNDKYDMNGESQYSRFSTRPFDMDPRLENRQYDLREFQGRSHAGRGPKGYKRSDTRIHEDVCEALMRAPDVDASEIEVLVNEGTVRLVGAVENRREKKTAEAVVEHCTGVIDVVNELQPRHLEPSRRRENDGRGQIRNITGLN